ncbi:MAG TPA: DUF6569 family protein [Methylomirabilota bacterium]|jgi:hypothetical protein|nr:DUF6569 family protein [Methylomirabilota bacterium]
MRATRRQFVRWLGLTAGTVGLRPATAWAERLRILGGGDGGGGLDRPSGQGSPDFHRFAAGVRIGETRTHGLLRVFWLHGQPGAPLAVTALEEARESGDLVITEQEQATVPELIVENRGKTHVLLLAGEILLGGKQNRVLTEDLLLPPLSGPRKVGVYCVEQGRWAGRAKEFGARGSFAAPGLRSKVLEKAGQGRVWAEVDRYARRAAAPSTTQSYQAIYDKPEVKAQLREAERGLDSRAAPGALGAAVFVGRTLAGLDLFFEPDLFAREWPKLLRAQALDAYGRPEAPDPDQGPARARAEDLLRAAATIEGTLHANAGAGRVFEYRAAGQQGSALLFEGRVMHAVIL